MNSVSVTLNFPNLAAMIAHFSGDTSVKPVFTSVNTPAHDEDDETPNLAPPATDSAGMPWDERIHAPSKGTIKDGTWRAKKGVSDELKAQVTAELSATTAPPMPTAQPTPQPQVTTATPIPTAQPTPQATTAPPMPTAQPTPQVTTAPPMPTAQPTPQVTTAPPMPTAQPTPQVTTAPPMPTAQPTPQVTTAPQNEFQSFMEKMQPIMQSGAVDAAYLSGLTSEIAGTFAQPLSAITDIASNPQMINFAIQAMQRDGKWTA